MAQQEQIQNPYETAAARLSMMGGAMLVAETVFIAGEATRHVEASALANIMVHGTLGVGGLGALASGLLRLHELRRS